MEIRSPNGISFPPTQENRRRALQWADFAKGSIALATDQSKHATLSTQFRFKAINVTQALLTHRNAGFSTTLVRSLLALQRNAQYNVTTVFLTLVLTVQRHTLFNVK